MRGQRRSCSLADRAWEGKQSPSGRRGRLPPLKSWPDRRDGPWFGRRLFAGQAYTWGRNRPIQAVIDAGVFRPLKPVELAEGTRVEVRAPAVTATPAATPADELSPEELARQRAAIELMLADIEGLPVEEPDDGFSCRDHDRLLYGTP